MLLLVAFAPGAVAQGTQQPSCELVTDDDWCEEWVSTFGAGNADLRPPHAVLSPDGKQLFAMGYEFHPAKVCQGLCLDSPTLDIVTAGFDTATGENVWVARYPAGSPRLWSAEIAVSPDGTKVFVVGARRDEFALGGVLPSPTATEIVTLAYDAATGEQLWMTTSPSENGGKDIAVTPDGSTVVVVSNQREAPSASDNTARCSNSPCSDIVMIAYDASTGEQRWLSHGGERESYDDADGLVLSPDGKLAYVTGYASHLTPERDDPNNPYDGAEARAVTIAYAVSGPSAGEAQWVALYADEVGSPSYPYRNAQGWHITASEDGERVFVAVESGPWGDSRIATVAYDAATGEQLWSTEHAEGQGMNEPVFKG